MKKIALISLAIMASLFPLCSMAQQGVKVNVHTGANLSGLLVENPMLPKIEVTSV